MDKYEQGEGKPRVEGYIEAFQLKLSLPEEFPYNRPCSPYSPCSPYNRHRLHSPG